MQTLYVRSLFVVDKVTLKHISTISMHIKVKWQLSNEAPIIWDETRCVVCLPPVTSLEDQRSDLCQPGRRGQ